MNAQTSLFTYDITKDCVTLHMRCLRQGKCINNLQLLHWNSNLETQLSNIVGNCSFYKFKSHSKNTFDDFMKYTIHQSMTSKDDDNKIVTNVNDNDDDLGNNHDTSNQTVTKDDNKSPPTTDNENPNTTTDHSTLEDVDVEGNNNTLSTSDDINKDNNNDTTNQVVTQYGDDDENNIDTDYSSAEDGDTNKNNTILSPNTDNNVGDNTDINDLLVTDTEENDRRNTNKDHNQLGEQTSILLLGMSTVNVQRMLNKKGNTDMLDKISLLTAQQCVAKKYFDVRWERSSKNRFHQNSRGH